MIMKRSAAFFAVLCTVTLLVPNVSMADATVEIGSTVRIDSGTATPARLGQATTIRFVVFNDSATRLHLAGLSTPAAESVYLIARTGPNETKEIGSIGVPADEVLDLTTSHLWYEAYPVNRPLLPGDTIEVTLDFVSWKITVPIHVHADGAGG